MPKVYSQSKNASDPEGKPRTGDLRLRRFRATLIGVLAVIATSLVIGGAVFHHAMEDGIQRSAYVELEAITQLRVNQVLAWRADSMAEAAMIAADPLFLDAVARWRTTPGATPDAAKITGRLLLVDHHQQAQGVAVLFPDGQSVGSREGRLHLGEPSEQLIARAAQSGAVQCGDIYPCKPCGGVHLEIAAPLLDASRQPLGTLLLRLDPRQTLFSLLNFWPGLSQSAESLLVLRGLSEAAVLNEPRHDLNAPAPLRMPLSNAEDIVVRAALGESGHVEGIDYRGARVLSDIQNIPATPWIVISKIDRSEVLASARLQSALVFLLVLLGVLLSFVSAFAVFRYRQGYLYRKLYRAERDRSRMQEEYRATLYSIGEGVITTDARGNVRTMNEAAVALTGCPEDEARGRRLEEVYKSHSGGMHEPQDLPVEQLLRGAGDRCMTRNVCLAARDGSLRNVAETATTIVNGRDQVTGVALVFRDQTAEVEAQRAVRESEERLRLALAAASQGMYDIDLQSGVRTVSREYMQMVEEDAAQELERLEDWAKSIHPDDFNRVAQVYRDYLAGRIPEYRAEYRRKTAAGDWIWILALGKVVEWDAEGRPRRMVGTHTNITPRKDAEAALLRETERAQRYLDVAGVILLVLDVNGSISRLNRKGCELLGVAEEKVLGRNWFETYVSPALRHELHTEFEHMMGGRGPEQIRAESEITLPGGAAAIIAWHHTLLRDADGAVTGRLSSGEDITGKKLVEQERDQLAHVVSQSPVVITIVDTSGRIVYVNQRFTEVTGYAPEEVLGKNPRILKSNETTQEDYRQLWGVITQGGIWRGEFHNRRKDGQLFWEYATISPLRNAANEITHYVAFKEDMGERKLLEAQLRQAQKMDSIGRLAGGVAHDFNNMLNVILGHADLAAGHLARNHAACENLQEITRAAERSADLTRQLLAFARKQTVSPKVIDLNAHIPQLRKMLERLIGENISLEWAPGEALWPIRMDPSQLDQVLVNLAVNARDAIAGPGRLMIQTCNQRIDETYLTTHFGSTPGQFVLLTVSDTGTGMNEQVLAHLFEPFFSTKAEGKGTGLGLATVYGIIKQNNGYITAYSEPGKGSTFKILLPSVASDALTDDAGEAALLPVVGGNETILVVEDEELILDLCTRILEASGYTVLAASLPDKALRLAEQFDAPIHLLISDVVMPGMSGKELRERVYSLRKETKSLFMSGYTADVISHHGIIDKRVNFIAKPFTSSTLLRAVRASLDGS